MTREQLKLIELIKQGYGFTHGGRFHADDVLSACTLRILNPNFRIIRGNTVPEGFDGVVFDIGLGRYDHHQADTPTRDGRRPYAAFGLLWRDLYPLFMDEKHFNIFDASFIAEIDRCDNTPNTNLLSLSIESFNPCWNEEQDTDEKFERAVYFYTPLLRELIAYAAKYTYVPHYVAELNSLIKETILTLYYEKSGKKEREAEQVSASLVWDKYGAELTEAKEKTAEQFINQIPKVYGYYKSSPFIQMLYSLGYKNRRALLKQSLLLKIKWLEANEEAEPACEAEYQKSERKDVICLPYYIPYDTMIKNHYSVRAVIFPSERGGYNFIWTAAPPAEKNKFPEYMRGKSEEELRKIQKGLFFVHSYGHMASFDTAEDALEGFDKFFYRKQPLL